MMTDFSDYLDAKRQEQLQAQKVHNAEEALAFVNRTGFCLFKKHSYIALPALSDISEGQPWLWKDQLPLEKRAYYGRRFRRMAGFVSLEMLPALYALSPTAEFQGDRFELYRMGYISERANQLASVVNARGPLTTRELRQASGLAGEAGWPRFSRSIIEMEMKFLVTKVGVKKTNQANFIYVWDSFSRYWQDIFDLRDVLSHEEAGRVVILQYTKTMIAVTIREVAVTLNLSQVFVKYIVEQLASEHKLEALGVGKKVYYMLPDMYDDLKHFGMR